MIDLFTIVWGPSAELYLRGCLPALLHESNIPALEGDLTTYTFYASVEARNTIQKHPLYRVLDSLVKVDWQPLLAEYDCNNAFRRQMMISDMRRAYMLCIGPEEIWGAGSIRHIADLAFKGFNPILYGYSRVSRRGYDKASTGGEPTNRHLVSLAMQHRTDGDNYKVWKVHEDVWLVYYNIPTLCLLPDNRIFDFYSTNKTRLWGYDHILPIAMVEWGYPWHMITDSDDSFMVTLGEHTLSDEGHGEPDPSWAQEITHESMNPTRPSRIEDIGWRGIKFFGAIPEVWHR
jgi:hypothetical protein